MQIFISSTFRDLKTEREKLHKSLTKAGFDSFGMEFFVAEPNTPKEVCLREIQKSNLVLLLSDNSYGTTDEESKKSYTHLEFDTAIDTNIEILAFLQNDPTDSDTKDFHAEIKGSGITVDFFDDKSDIPSVVFPALFKYVISHGFIDNKTKTFNDFTHFYARSLQKDSLFNYNQKIVGRANELAQLESFLSDQKQKLVIISAAGGIGKSKLVYEFAQNKLGDSDWNFCFVPWQVGFDNNSIAELPSQDTCVVIEDAHKQKNLDSLLYSILNQSPHRKKIIITTRPSGYDSIQESLREYDPCDPLILERLSRDDSIELANSILEGNKQRNAKAIYNAANGNTLVIVMASELIQKEILNDAFIKDPTFQEKVLDRMLSELDKIDSQNIDLRELLATISGLSPLLYEPNTIEELSKHFRIEKHALRSILDDLQKHGFVLKIGNRLRVIPDILADYILFKCSVNSSKQPTGFIDSLLEKYGKHYFNNILVNTSELEYSIPDVDLANNIWESIEKRISDCNFQELSSVLKTIEQVSYFVPEKVYDIVGRTLKGEIKIREDEKENRRIYDFKLIINSIISILAKLGHHPKFTKKACLLLWEISTNPDYLKWLDNFSESPTSTFKKLASFDNDNPFSIQKEAMETVKEIINANKHIGVENNLCEIIESPLRFEIENNSYSRREFSVSWFCVYDIPKGDIREKVISARKNAFDLYSLLIDEAEDPALYLIAERLSRKLFVPYYRGKKLPDRGIAEIQREANIVIELMEKIINKNIPILNNAIFELFENKKRKLLENVDISKILPEGIKNQYEIYYCIRHDYPQDYDDNIEETDIRFNKRQEQTAKRLWKSYKNNPEHLLDFIIDYRSKLEKHGINCGGHTFLIVCAKVKPKLCSQAIYAIIRQDSNNYAALTIGTWLQNTPKEQQLTSANSILDKGNPCHRESLTRSLSQLKGLSESELVEIIETLSKDPESKVRDATIRRLGVVCYHRKIKAELARVFDVLCSYDTQDDANKLEMLFDNLNPHYISLDTISDRQYSLLLKKIKTVEKLDGNDIGNFLSYIITKKPLECIEIFIWRIQNKTSEDAQVFPYNEGFREKPSDLINHPDYTQGLITLLTAMEEYEWRAYFWCPTIVRWLDPSFSEKTKQIFLENVNIHKNALKAITYIFIRYEAEFFFPNIDFVNELLTQASRLPDKDVYQSIQGKLAFMPFSGGRCMSGLGQDDGLCLDIIKKCDEILVNDSLSSSLISFYENLKQYADEENKKKLGRDQAELEEEEFQC